MGTGKGVKEEQGETTSSSSKLPGEVVITYIQCNRSNSEMKAKLHLRRNQRKVRVRWEARTIKKVYGEERGEVFKGRQNSKSNWSLRKGG